MTEIEQIKTDIVEIKERNRRVEADKAWETSAARKLLIAILTYVVVSIFFYFVNLPKPLISAVVPTLGFLLSTFSIPLFKKIWINNHLK